MYQAVELDLFNEGQLVPVAERAVDVIENRAAMVRVFVTPTESFLARTLSARLFVENEGEDIQVFHHKKNVSVPSSQANLDTTFQLDIPAEALKAATRYWIEVVECGDLPPGEIRTVRVPTTPGENGEFSARETGVIKVVFVPVTHDGRTPDVSESTIAEYADAVERMYPTTGVEWSVRDPIASNQSGSDINLESTLNLVTILRYEDGEDGVPDDVYYYGLIDPASSFNDYCSFSCTTGVAWVLEEGGFWQGSDRAGVGIGFGTEGVGTFAHELGHNHGRDHAPCNVGGDANYPYGGGSIGVWGYDLRDQELKDPASHADFMGYCNSNWVSDYSYNAYAVRVASANGVSGGFQSLVRLSEAAIWYRMVVTETEARWLPPVERQGVPQTRGETASIFDSAGNVIETVEVHRVRMSHGDGFMLYVPEPQSGWFSVGVAGGPILVF